MIERMAWRNSPSPVSNRVARQSARGDSLPFTVGYYSDGKLLVGDSYLHYGPAQLKSKDWGSPYGVGLKPKKFSADGVTGWIWKLSVTRMANALMGGTHNGVERQPIWY
jgi:hypothetical protein